MKVYAIDHLDPYYYGETENPHTDPSVVDEYASMRECRDSFWRMCDGERLGDECRHERWIFFYDPCGDDVHGDAYPDRIMKLGPRGGVSLKYA